MPESRVRCPRNNPAKAVFLAVQKRRQQRRRSLSSKREQFDRMYANYRKARQAALPIEPIKGEYGVAKHGFLSTFKGKLGRIFNRNRG